ncbi:MAG: hypothetical protein AAF542_16965 [Pseudomonadota bacterium]
MVTFSLNTAEAAPSGSSNPLAEAEESIGFIPKLDATLAAAPGHLASYKFFHERFSRSDISANEFSEVWQEINVVLNRGIVGEVDFQAFIDSGFTKRNILETILGLDQKIMSNYTNHLVETPVNPTF